MQDLNSRTFEFALRVVKLVARLPKNRIADVIGRQLLRSGTSIGANWQEATGASSPSDFIYRVEICERESRETNYWIKLLGASGVSKEVEIQALEKESNELVAIFTTIGRKSKRSR
jgi:four helix bundle protein